MCTYLGHRRIVQRLLNVNLGNGRLGKRARPRRVVHREFSKKYWPADTTAELLLVCCWLGELRRSGRAHVYRRASTADWSEKKSERRGERSLPEIRRHFNGFEPVSDDRGSVIGTYITIFYHRERSRRVRNKEQYWRTTTNRARVCLFLLLVCEMKTRLGTSLDTFRYTSLDTLFSRRGGIDVWGIRMVNFDQRE